MGKRIDLFIFIKKLHSFGRVPQNNCTNQTIFNSLPFLNILLMC